MIRVCIIVREPGLSTPDYSLDFDLPALPQRGDYISVQRPDKPRPYGEDMIVREIWWRLDHPETGGVATTPPKTGKLHEIMIECEPATSPYSSDRWREVVEGQSPESAPSFDVQRMILRESELEQPSNRSQLKSE